MRILIIEDDPVLADGLTRSLRAVDYAVDCAVDGSEADHVLAAQNYDLVILDLGLPKVDGFEVLRRLRRRGSRVPVLVLTARDTLDDRVKASTWAPTITSPSLSTCRNWKRACGR